MKLKIRSNKERADMLHNIFDKARDEKEKFCGLSDFIEKMNKRLIKRLNDNMLVKKNENKI